MVEFTPHPGEEILRDRNWAASSSGQGRCCLLKKWMKPESDQLG
jgi:hypothetical protein